MNTEEVKDLSVALSGDDDKREILSDRIHTLAHGHYDGCETIRILPRI